MYHPSQDYNDDSQVDPEFRPTKEELRKADEEVDLEVIGSGKEQQLSGCTYVNMLVNIHMFHFFRTTLPTPKSVFLRKIGKSKTMETSHYCHPTNTKGSRKGNTYMTKP